MLADPAGLPYCITDRDPATGELALSQAMIPAARAGSAYAAASESTVSWAFSPLGLGTTHSSAGPSPLGLPADGGARATEGGPVRRHAEDRDHPRPHALDQRDQQVGALAQLGGGELVGPRASRGVPGWRCRSPSRAARPSPRRSSGR